MYDIKSILQPTGLGRLSPKSESLRTRHPRAEAVNINSHFYRVYLKIPLQWLRLHTFLLSFPLLLALGSERTNIHDLQGNSLCSFSICCSSGVANLQWKTHKAFVCCAPRSELPCYSQPRSEMILSVSTVPPASDAGRPFSSPLLLHSRISVPFLRNTNKIPSCTCSIPSQNWANGLSALDPNSNDRSMPGNLGSSAGEAKDDSDVLIECRDVHKSFGEKKILRGVNFKIRHGEAVGIIGPSGTGKSTILKIIAGLLAPDKGEVLICGKRRHGLVSDEEISGLRIGLVFQSAALFDSLTVRENVGFLLYENSRMPGDKIAELVTENLAAVGLKGVEDRMPSELSGGMKKRVALARSIIFDNTKEVIEPEVLLYDEPTAGLDPIASTVVEDLIRSVHLKGEDALGKPGKIASYVVVTHQHSTIKRAVDRLLFLHDGKVVWEGMTHEFTNSENPIVRQFASGSLDGPIRY